jgi:predicted nucleic acid-binding protein
LTTVVLDASVACKWYLSPAGESHSEQALSLLERHTQGGVEFAVPDLFWAEFGNIFWNAVRRGRCGPLVADEAVKDMRRRSVLTLSSFDLLPQAFEIANAYGRTVYDGLYVALAYLLGIELITADERLANALTPRFPVRWLGAI